MAEKNRGHPPTPSAKMRRLTGRLTSRLPKLTGGAVWDAWPVETVDPDDQPIDTVPVSRQSGAAPAAAGPNAARS